MHLVLWYVVLVCHQYEVCENSVDSVYICGYGDLSESGLMSSVNCVQSAFFVVLCGIQCTSAIQ